MVRKRPAWPNRVLSQSGPAETPWVVGFEFPAMAAIWHNLTRAGERYNVTLMRLFRNGDVWKESNHFGRDDLLQAAKVLDLAHTWIHQQDRLEKATTEQTNDHRQ